MVAPILSKSRREATADSIVGGPADYAVGATADYIVVTTAATTDPARRTPLHAATR